jgi:hypothetical protein
MNKIAAIAVSAAATVVLLSGTAVAVGALESDDPPSPIPVVHGDGDLPSEDKDFEIGSPEWCESIDTYYGGLENFLRYFLGDQDDLVSESLELETRKAYENC